MIRQRYEDKRIRIEKKCKEMKERQKELHNELLHMREGLELYHQW